jgi:acyl-CoA synthetase (AMP-forming)/AMP-acid ligase II
MTASPTPGGTESTTEPTLPNVIRACAAEYGGREFIAEADARHSYHDIEAASAELALGLLASGVGKATRVGLLMGNSADWVTCWWAAARCGAFTIPISTFFQAKELAWVLAKADIDTLLVQRRVLNADYEDLLEQALPGLAAQRAGRIALASHPFLRRIVVFGPCDRPWATRGKQGLLEASREAGLDRGFLAQVEEQVTPSDLLVAICTSGSTAEPKIVVHTHGSVIRATQAFRTYLKVAHDERNYTGMPLFWIGGLNVNLLQVMYEGACMVFPRSPRQEDVLDAVLRERVTRVSVQPAQQAALLDAARERGVDLSFVRTGLFEPRDTTGKIIPAASRGQGNLGMSETFGAHGYWHFDQPVPAERLGSAGRTLPGMDRRVVDPDTGQPLPHGETGELQVRGFSLMQGYYKRERSEVFTPDGFFPTGDRCVLDEAQFVYVKGRSSEMIKTAGANVSPSEVEIALIALGHISEAMVFGVPHAQRGENVVAAVVGTAGARLEAEDLRARLKGQISAYKVPAEILVLPFEIVPRTPGGKGNKAKVREMYIKGELVRP